MTNVFKTVQSYPTATTDTTLYTVPASTQTVVSTLMICNQGIGAKVRVAVRVAGAALEAKQYLLYDRAIDANDSLPVTIGLTLATTDIVSVRSDTGNVSFNLSVQEIT